MSIHEGKRVYVCDACGISRAEPELINGNYNYVPFFSVAVERSTSHEVSKDLCAKCYAPILKLAREIIGYQEFEWVYGKRS